MAQPPGGAEPRASLCVRKDLYPSVEPPEPRGLEGRAPSETDFERSVDEIARRKRPNGLDAADLNGLSSPAPAPKRRRPPKVDGGKDLSALLSGEPAAAEPRGRRAPRAPRPAAPPEKPKSGKPRSMMGMGSSGGRKKQQKREERKAPVETYHSQISEDANAIKIKIRKSSSQTPIIEVSPTPKKIVVESKRKRNASPVSSSSSGEEYDPSSASTVPVSKPRVSRPRPLRPHNHAKNTHGKDGKLRSEPVVEDIPQSPWGVGIPEELLSTIFKHVIASDGTLPALIRLGEVCKLWHAASKTPALWGAVELSHHTRDKWKTDYRLNWLLENRLSMCYQLNLSNWKVSNLSWIVKRIVELCPGIRELNLSGWKRLTNDQLREFTLGLPKLARLDLSCTSETGSSGSCLSVASLTHLAQTMADHLTHLTLANNKLTGLPLILAAIANHCPSLELLDLSNLAAVSHPASVPLERLQKGCPRLRILRITNSQVVLATATTQEQVESPGFPLLEELSVACPSTDYKLVDDEVLGRLLKTSTCLKLLDVRGCIRITDSGLIKVPAWDLQHLFLSGCCVTRQSTSCLELICEKWSHSLLEVDLAWSTATQPLDAAVEALAEKGDNSMLKILNLCGSSVSFAPVKTILLKCPHLESVNLSSCRALPRGMKRLYTGKELKDLRDSFDPEKIKEKQEAERLIKENKKKIQDAKNKADEGRRKSITKVEGDENGEKDASKMSLKDCDLKSPKDDSLISESEKDEASTSMKSPASALSSPALTQATASVRSIEQEDSPQSVVLQISPIANKGSASLHEQFSPQQSSSAISTPKSNHMQEYSPVPRPSTSEAVSASNIYDSDSRQETGKNSGAWNAGQYSPMTKQDGPTSSHPSPDTGNSFIGNNKQDTPKPSGSWNFGHFSPSVVRQDSSPYPAQQSPYPSQTSPDMGQPVNKSNQNVQSSWNLEKFSPVMRQESACSSQPSPETGQVVSRSGQGNWNLERFSPMPSSSMLPSPDTSQVTSSGKSCGQWNLDRFSPMTRTESSPAAVPSPETGVSNVKTGPWNLGHYSPLTRSEMSPVAQPSPETTVQTASKSNWNLGHYSPMTRQEASPIGQQPSPGGAQSASKTVHNNWNIGNFSPMSKVDSSSSSQRHVQSDIIPNMWDTARTHYSSHETSVKSDAERTGNCFGNIDQVTTTTYCSGSGQGMYSGYHDPLNGPSSIE